MKNLEMLALAARGLGPLKDEVVFVGGATIELYLAGQPVLKIRATEDVDCVVEVATLADHHSLEEKLRARGFQHCLDAGAPICRWEYQGVLVDVMPSEIAVLGFTNRWYPEGFQHSILVRLPDNQEIKIFSLPYFIASKIEAFKGRGRGDFTGSSDMEDIVTVIDGTADFLNQIAETPTELRSYLRNHFQEFLTDERFQDGLVGHLPPAAGLGRAARVYSIVETLAKTAIEKTEKKEIWEEYENLRGNSGVSRYQIGIDSIKVEFWNQTRYLYNYESAGESNIEQMKELAASGQGLNAFINVNVKHRSAKKL